MKWSSVLVTFLLGSLEIRSASLASSPSKSPKKKLPISASSTPSKLDSRILKNLNDFARSPLKVTDEGTSRLALDFDELNKDKSFPSTIFYPKEESISLNDSWVVPLHKVEDMKNLMNLESKLADVRAFLREELVDNASSLYWVSNGDRLINLILVVSTSISQLSYLISRLSVTDCSSAVSKRITSLVSEHLKTLADFCEDIIGYSGRVGMTLAEGKLKSPEKYFENLFALREETNLELNDEMFEIFLEFLFGAYASEFPETVIKCYMAYVDSEHWAPLPIIYFRERMLTENPEDFALFISQWKERVFSGEGFDSRNLVNLGFMLQIGIFTKKTFFAFIESVKPHKAQFKFNKEMIKFLTLLASTPWLLPADQDAALLIGNFSFSSTGSDFPFHSETNKKAMMNFFWNFFVGSADFNEIGKEEYENLCKLIQRLDFAFPGIAESLWNHLTAKTENDYQYMKAEDVYEMFTWKIEAFDELRDLNEKIEFLNLNFSDEKTAESDLIDSKTLFLLFNFFTDVFADSVEAVFEEAPAAEHVQILNFCIKFFDTFLIKFAHKSVINYWYDSLDFIPTKLFNALNDLWMISQDGLTKLTPTDSLIWENVNKLVDYNEHFARIFMMTLMTKTRIYGKPAFSAKMSTPKCLKLNGEANALNLEYFRVILAVSTEGEIFDEFFVGLSDKLANEEVYFDSVETLFKEILENNLSIKVSGCAKFWSPLLMIHLTKLENEPSQHEFIMKCLRLYLKMNQKMEVSHELLMNMSVFMGFNHYIRGQLGAENNIETGIGFFAIDEEMSSEELQRVSSYLFGAFNFVVVNGVSLKDANVIFKKLIEMAKKLELFAADFKNTALLGLVFAVNSLLLSIIRIPEFVMPEEEKSVLGLHNFYLKFKECSPFYNENLLRTLRQRSSMVAVYENLIKNSEALPASAFDSPLMKDSRITLKLQQNYMNMLGSNPENMTIMKLNPISTWIKNGKIDASTFLKLLQKISPDQHRIVANCLALIAEFINNEQISVKMRVEALEIIFSQDNNEIIKSMANRRLFVLHENFINLLANGPDEVINSFLDACTEEDWYVGVKIEIERIKNQRTFEREDMKNSANFYIKDEGYSRDLMEILNASVPNYVLRRTVVLETDAFVGKMTHMLPILRDSVTNGPLENCFFHLISANLQMTDGLTFFKHYANPETFLTLLKMQALLFKKSLRRRIVLLWILDAIRVSDTRKAALRMLPHLITSDNFVLYGGVLKGLEKWFDVDFEFEHFLAKLVSSAFDSFSVDSTIERAPVLDGMFATFSEAFQLNVQAISTGYTIHHCVLDGLIKLMAERKDLIEKSKKLMEYLKFLVENLSANDLFMKVADILKEVPSFYLEYKMDWIIIWKKLIIKLPFEFVRTPVLRVYSKFGSEKFHDWKPVLNYIPAANLPTKVLTRLFIELSDEGKEQDLELLQILPEKLELDDVSSFKDVEILLKYILYCLECVEIEKEEISREIYEKLFVLLDFDVKIKGARIWYWRRILNITNSDREFERVALNSLAVKFPTLLDNSCTKVDEVLAVLFEFNTFNDKTPTEFNEIIAKAVEIYDKLTVSISNSAVDVETQVFEYLKGKLHVLAVENLTLHEILLLSLATLKEFKDVLAEIDCKGRNDRYAIDSIAFIFALATKIFSKNTNNLNRGLLSEFCDLVVEMVHDILNLGNLVGFAQAADRMNLETLISSISYHVKDNIEEFKFIINESMKFAPIDVADLFYQQISESDFRVDVCLFTSEIIGKFDRVTQEAFDVPDASWPGLYLRTLTKANSNVVIDVEHFKQFENLLEQVSDEMIPDQILVKIGILLQSRPNDLSNILDLVDSLHKRFVDDFILWDIYDHFLVNSSVKNLLKTTSSEQNRQRFVRFLKEMQKKSAEQFKRWESNVLESETQKLVAKALQSDTEAVWTSIHTGVADKMIARVAEVDFGNVEKVENFLNGFKNLKTNFVQVPVMFALESVFVNRLKAAVDAKNDLMSAEWVKSIQSCVMFLLNFPRFEAESFDILLEIVLRVFSEQLLLILVEKGENREGLRAILMILKSKIDFSLWKEMKPKLQRFKLWEDEEILVSVARNSDPLQLIEIVSSFKNLSVAKKFELLENCRLVGGNEKMSKLINFYRTILTSNENNKLIVLQSLMRNESVLNCFLNSQKKNLKNKLAVLSLLKANLRAKEIIKMAVDSSAIMKIEANLYFKPSSTKDSIIPVGFDDLRVLKEVFNCFLFEIQNDANIRNKTPMYMKAFRLYNEIEGTLTREDILDTATFNPNVLVTMTIGLDASLEASKVYISSPETIYAVYKLTRRLVTKKRERYAIMRKLLFPLRRSGVEAFLRAQLDSGNIDWNLHRELEDNARNNETISDILFNFELEHYT